MKKDTGTSDKNRPEYTRISDKNRPEGSIDDRIKQFVDRIKEIDASSKPPRKLLISSPKKYSTKYSIYRKQIASACSGVVKWIGAEKKVSLDYSRNLLTKFRREIEAMNTTEDVFYFEIRKLVEEYPDHASQLRNLAKKRNPELSHALTSFLNEYINVLPRKLYDKLDKLRTRHRHPAINYLKLNKQQKKIYKDKAKTAENERHQKSVMISVNKLRCIASHVLKNRKKMPWEALVCAVVLATGRRPIEVLKLGNFSASDKKDHMTFDGQAKIRGHRELESISIPIVAGNQKSILEAIEIIRSGKDFSNVPNENVNNRTAAPLNDYCRKLFENDALDLRILRTTYTSIIEREFFPNDTDSTSKPAYLASKLGHASNDYTTFVKYSWITPDWSEYTGPADIPESRIALDNKIIIEELIERVEKNRENILKHLETSNTRPAISRLDRFRTF